MPVRFLSDAQREQLSGFPAELEPESLDRFFTLSGPDLALHKDKVIGSFDAAVIDQEDGKPHVVKRMDRPGVRVIPEWFGGGTLSRKELHELAGQLTASQAGLIAVGEPTIEKALDKALDKALANAGKVVKRTVDATTDEITSELQEALKG